ncbi:hypothetical protein LPJ78_003134 [Coemansia sp. RSA 989]|nr:hypothetical protein LPJ68_002527 [Coemansia sp. RSA 1086]KAJ1750866.1 hypothetical protein LPJ79_002550 [Coemansia sp. RSA 1821]KAJ1864795.1 hypothetical protein LPJ78_003134 [Coemansia sp. RSA 989]KAJ1872156.1 hypothetical protein LPJ55_003327 [Coemansia sp. RSA 990]KAJ2669244.1 hypothetical protein IWW42_004710 [Coemansia sp. RSA 1085]
MTVEAEREKRMEAIERRLGGSQEAIADTQEANASVKSTTARRGKFPGSGQSLNDQPEETSDEEESDEEPELEDVDSGSDFEELLTEDEDDEGDYSDDEEIVSPRGGQGTYNLRTALPKRDRSSNGSDEDRSPRTRRRTAINYSEDAADED